MKILMHRQGCRRKIFMIFTKIPKVICGFLPKLACFGLMEILLNCSRVILVCLSLALILRKICLAEFGINLLTDIFSILKAGAYDYIETIDNTRKYKKKIENLILWNWYIKKHTSAKKRQC